MKFDIEKFISPLIESQFPEFYQAEGQNFILFVKAYYEWMEEDGEAVGEARNLFDYRDIDNTVTEFLSHFQQKYLYGIPFNVIANKRLLMKHIFDVYRSKGSLQCYKLLFKLIYNEDIDIYLPSHDLFIPSDGTWIEPRYLEVNDSDLLASYVGKKVKGLSSGYTAVVESFIKEPINQNIICTLNLSNIQPRNAEFIIGEKIILADSSVSSADIAIAPKVLGSLNSLNVINGGQDFNIGDILKIAHNDINTGQSISYGIDGIVRVTDLSSSFGSINFDIIRGGFGYTANSLSFFYPYTSNSLSITANTLGFDSINNTLKVNNANSFFAVNDHVYYEVPTGNSPVAGLSGNNYYYVAFANATDISVSTSQGGLNVVISDTRTTNPAEIHSIYNGTVIKDHQTGDPASFQVGSISFVQLLRYNTDIIANYYTETLDSLAYAFAGNPSANATTPLNQALAFNTNYFGSVASLTNIQTGNNYLQPGYATAKATLLSAPLPGTISYSPSANVVIGTGTSFKSFFSNGDVIVLRANPGFSYTEEPVLIREVVNDTYIKLWGPTTYASDVGAQYKTAPAIIDAQYAKYEPNIVQANTAARGLEVNISAVPSGGANVVATVAPVNSGKGYVDSELVTLYLYRAISQPTVIAGGTGYANGDALIITGGGTTSQARGFVTTDSNGSVVATALLFNGSGYSSLPFIGVKSTNGSGAIFSTTITEYNTQSQVSGRVKKTGTGRGKGYWSTTRSFLSADKYLQDSNYYQTFSYEVNVALTLNKYKDILYNTFHVSGTALFGKYNKTIVESEPFTIIQESLSPEIELVTDELLNNVIPDLLTVEATQGNNAIQQEQIL